MAQLKRTYSMHMTTEIDVNVVLVKQVFHEVTEMARGIRPDDGTQALL